MREVRLLRERMDRGERLEANQVAKIERLERELVEEGE
jgi:hypothetical protein